MTTPTAGPSDVQQEIERNYRWNFIVNSIDGASFWFGMSFFSSAIILPLYVSHFTDSPLVLGLIPFLGWAGVFLPQLFVANAVERAPRKKYFPVTLGFFLERLPVFLMVPATYFLATNQPVWALVVFFLLYTWHNFGTGLVIIGWQDMIAKIFPVDRRGRFFGITNFIGNGSGILGAMLVPFVLDRFDFPTGYVLAFAAAGVLIFISWVSLAQTREPAVYSTKPPVSQLEYLRSLPEILRKDRNFRMYLLTQIIYSMSGMAAGFLVVYTVQRWNLPDAEASGYMLAMQIGMTVSNLIFGFLADRMGHKLNLEICFGLSVLSLVLAFSAPMPIWFFLVFFLRGAISAGIMISGFSIVYEFTSAENRPTYIGLANTIPGIAGSIAPLIGGWLAGLINYQTMFGLSAVFGVAAWVLLRFSVKEPRLKKEPDRFLETSQV